MRLVFFILLYLICCEDSGLNERSRPSDSSSEIPDFEIEEIKSIKANFPGEVRVSNTTLTISENTLSEDTEIRLRKLKNKPTRTSVAALGEAKGEVIEVVMYNQQTEEIYASSLLEKPFVATQSLKSISNEANLKYVVISNPGSDSELVQVLSRKAIVISNALVSSNLNVSINLNATHLIFYAIESAEEATSVTILDSGNDISSESGGVVTVASSASTSSSSSSSSSSSGGSEIDCSGLGNDPEKEAWIAVPANPEVGQTKAFCVMKYEAKIAGSINDADGDQPYEAQWKPESRISGTPWMRITQNQAITECASLGEGYELITNEMWQTIARNIETAQSIEGEYLNWFNASPSGANAINRGHSDANPSSVLPGDVTSDPCAGTYQTQCANQFHPDFSQKRTHTLSNEKIIWDFAGNISEWNSSTLKEQGIEDYIVNNPANQPNANEGKLKWGPTYDYHSPNPGANPENFEFPKQLNEYGGLGFGYLSDQTAGAVNRGGRYNHGPLAGIFAANLERSPTYASSYIGFRCAYTTE